MSFEESYYENADLWRDGSFGDADNERITAVAAKVPADATTLLDAGCGNGLFLKHLRSLGTRSFKRLVGVDRSAAALEHVDTEKVRASLDALPFANREFDAVTCLEVLEHLPQEIYSGTLDEIARVAGRYVLVSVPHDENITMAFTECDNCRFHFNPNYHLRSFDEPALRRLLDSRGFRCLETFFIYPVRLVPVSIESMLRMLGRLKRLVLSQPRAPMVGGTVCPSCGYSDRSSDGTAKGTDTSRRRTAGETVRSGRKPSGIHKVHRLGSAFRARKARPVLYGDRRTSERIAKILEQ